MKKIIVFVLLFSGCWLSLRPLAVRAENDLKKTEQRIAKETQAQAKLDALAKETAQNLRNLRQRMVSSAKALQQKEAEQEGLENKLDQLTLEIAEKSKQAEADREQLSLMISALIEIAGRPPESLFFQDRAKTDHIHRSILLRSILPGLKDKAESAAKDLSVLYELRTKLADHKRLVSAARANLEKQQKSLDQMIATRQGFLSRTEEQKAQIAKQLLELTQEAKDLGQLMEKVAPKKPKKTQTKSSATLKWPVAGTVRKSFGHKDADGVKNEGLTIAGPSGAPVVAPLDGKVVFVGPFRGYGQIMILQHENDSHTFLAGFGRIDAEMGQEVDSGEPLGVLPVHTGTRPEMYFEWRRRDKPVDPSPMLENR